MRRLALLLVISAVCVLTAGVASADYPRSRGYHHGPAPSRHHAPRHYPGYVPYAVPRHHHHHHDYRPYAGGYSPYRSYSPYCAPSYGYPPIYRGSGFSLHLGF